MELPAPGLTVRDPERSGVLLNTVHGALRYYDIPNLQRM